MENASNKPDMPLEFDDMVAFLTSRGFPSFDQFRKNPEKFRLNRYDLFESIEKSMTIDRNDLAKQKMYWRYEKQTVTFGQLLRRIQEEGYKPEDVDVMPYRAKNDSGTGKDVIYVRVFPKFEIRMMGGVIPND